MPVLAHAGHWIGSLLYVLPVALIALAVGVREVREKRAGPPAEPDAAPAGE